MLTYTEFSGSPFQIGVALGRFGAPVVHNQLMHSEKWEHVMGWRDSDAALTMQGLVKQHFPYIWDELQGLARGLDIAFNDVFLWNCRGDLDSLSADGCTTVLQPTPDGPRITHNEDGDADWNGHCAIGEFTLDQGISFASFVYPGSLAGHAFAVTDTGLAMTVNNIHALHTSPGVPRLVLTRALLTMPDLSNAVSLLGQVPRAGGFHLSLAQQGGSGLLSIEFTASDMSVQPVKAPTIHANHLVHKSMQDQPQHVSDSSRRRQQGVNALLDTTQGIDPLRILADHAENRNTHPHTEANYTLASVDIHVGSEQVDWDIYEHPGETVRFRMINAKHV